MDDRSSTGDACQRWQDPLKIAGSQPHRLDRSFALLSDDVYREDGRGADGWLPVPDQHLKDLGVSPALMRNPETGFYARLYVHESHGYVLAFRGTNQANDWIANARQSVGLETQQYTQAAWLAVTLDDATGRRPLVATGHSLGAGMAAVAALRIGASAVTFNAAGVHASTLEHLGIQPEQARTASETGQVRRYTVDNDILTALQEHDPHLRHLLPDPIGHRIRLADPEPLSLLSRLHPYNRLTHALETHSMDTVIRAMDAPREPEGRSHPGGTLVAQSIRGLHRLADAQVIAHLPGHTLVNTAACLAARASESGMSRIDHLVCSDDGSRLFAIQGSQRDPAQRRASVEVGAAASVPARSSAAAIDAAFPGASAPPLVPRLDWQQPHCAMGH